MKAGSIAMWLSVILLLATSPFAQEGEGETEGEGESVAKCRLTTTTEYPLPAIPPVIRETVKKTYTGGGLLQFVGVWVKVLKSNPSDRIEILVDGSQKADYPMPMPLPSWEPLPAVDLGMSVPTSEMEVQVRTTIHTDVPEPSLVLIGAVQFLPIVPLPTIPTEFNTLQDYNYAPDFTIPGYTPPGIVNVITNPQLVADFGPLQGVNYVAVHGGISGVNTPRLSVSWSFIEGGNAEGENEGETEGENGGEGEPGPFIPPSLDLYWGNTILHSTVLSSSMPSCMSIVRTLDSVAGATGKPAVEVFMGESTLSGSRIIIDDFILTYAPESYKNNYPWLYLRYGNQIVNGDFETGTDPFVIESVGGYEGCPDIDTAVQDIGSDACSGSHAVVFEQEEVVPVVPVIKTCSIEPNIVAKGETLRLTLMGENLQDIGEVRLVPELDNDGSAYVLMEGVDAEGATTTAEYTYRFNGPCNLDASGNLICTDGQVKGFYYTETSSGTLKSIDSCGTDGLPLVDTVSPILIVTSPEGTNAAMSGATPFIQAYRVVPSDDFPAFWAPQNNSITPKNAASYLLEDMHVYLKRNDNCPSESEKEILKVNLQATFLDPYPVCNGVFYEVVQSGFKTYSSSINNNLARYPDVEEGESGVSDAAGTARWTSDPGNIEGSLSFSHYGTDNGTEMQADWQLQIEVGGSGAVSFKLEATDRAGNLLDTSLYNDIYLHWLCCPVAKLDGNYAAGQRVIDLPWSLDHSPLPGALPACAPLAKFRVYSRNKDTGALTLKGNSIWQPGPLRETTRFVEDGRSLRAIVDDTLAEGNDVCIGIIGADEAGNVQCRAYDAIQYESDFGGTNPISYISIPTEDRGTKPRANEAIDTAVRVNLIHEYYNDKQDTVETIRSYGAATRVALPSLVGELLDDPVPELNEYYACLACSTRVNAGLEFRANMPAGSIQDYSILWKLYQDGALVARGVTDSTKSNVIQTANLMGLLIACNQGYSSAELADYDSSGNLILESRSLNRNIYLAIPPGDENLLRQGYQLRPCPIPAFGADIEFFRRLGDEGNPPNPDNPNWPSERRREIFYTLTAQTVINSQIDLTPASVSFSIYVREAEAEIRDEAPIREFSR